jgi:hypothetical protein
VCCAWLDICLSMSEHMPMTATLKRRSYFVDDNAVQRAKRILGAATDADVVRIAIDRVIEMDKFRKFVEQTARSVPRGSFRV